MTDTFWKIDAIVKGKHLERALEGLMGAVHLEPPRPVANAEPTNHKKIKAVSTAGSIFERVVETLPRKGSEIDFATLKKQITKQGAGEGYAGQIVKQLVAEKHLKRTGRGQYVSRGH